MARNRISKQSFGLGLRHSYNKHILENPSDLDFVEALTENFMGMPGRGAGRPLHVLEKVRAELPVVFHGVSLSIGSTDPLNLDYLKRLKNLISRIEPLWVSDHLCWVGTGGHSSHDLLPLPYNEESLDHLTDRVLQVQEFLGLKLALENASTYLEFTSSTIPEWEYLAELTRRTDCELLLDVNNIYVNSVNHQFDPNIFVQAIPRSRVRQIHLAGHTQKEGYIIDTHDEPICDPVWSLYKKAIQHLGPVPTLIERDGNIPEYPVLLQELSVARKLCDEAGDEPSVRTPEVSHAAL